MFVDIFADQPGWVWNYSFQVVDAALGEYLPKTFPHLRWSWSQKTAGSTVHQLTDAHDRQLVIIIARSGGAMRTSVVVWVNEIVANAKIQAGRILYGFQQWLLNDQGDFERWAQDIPNPGGPALTQDSLPPEPKRRGPAPKPYTVWAREQVAAGKTLEEILDDYMEMRGDRDRDDPEQRERAYESLRQAIARGRQ